MEDEPLTVLVDANNVMRSRWPNLAPADVASRSCRWAARHGGQALVVFDRRAPADVGLERCTVLGSGSRSADELLVDEAARLAIAGARYWLVTSDRALRDAAGRHAERTIGGGTFAGELQALTD
jgi:hypothetical protein